MPAPRRTQGRFPSSRRRKVTWLGPADQGHVAVAAGAATIIASFTPSTNTPSFAEPTVVRTRGEVAVIPASAAADVNIVGAYGLAVVLTAAFTAGVASIPTPWNEPSWDGWFVWRSFNASLQFIDGTGAFMWGIRQEVDSKAMRKVTADETIVFVAESQAAAFEISMPLRILLKLS